MTTFLGSSANNKSGRSVRESLSGKTRRVPPVVVATMALLGALTACGCISISSNSPPTTKTHCTTTDNGPGTEPTTTCTSEPSGGHSFWFFL